MTDSNEKPPVPNYVPDVGRLATDRYDFQSHVNGTAFRHNATQIDLLPNLTISSTTYTNVQTILEALATLAGSVPPVPLATGSTPGLIQLSGDITGTATRVTVSGLRGFPVSTLTPSTGNILTWNGSAWTPAAPSSISGAASGDLAGTYPGPTVVRINGATVPLAGAGFTSANIGNTLQITNNSPPTLNYAPLNLAGGAHYVTGVLPAANLSNLAGDVTGVVNSNTISKLQGITLAASSPTDGYVLQYNGSAWIPALINTGGGTAGGDLSGTYPDPTVVKIQGNAVSGATPTTGDVLEWTGTNWAPTLPLYSSFVYRQGSGATGPVVFGTFAGAVAAANNQGGPCTIVIDPTDGYPVATAGNYNLLDITLDGYSGAGSVVLTFQTNAIITNAWSKINNLILTNGGHAAVFTPQANTLIRLGASSGIQNTSSGTSVFMYITNSGCGIIMEDDTVLGDGTNQCISINSSYTLLILAGYGSQILPNFFEGITTGACEVLAAFGSTVSLNQPFGTHFAVGYPSIGSRRLTPNSVTNFATSFSPGSGGAYLAAVDITPSTSGNIFLSATFWISTTDTVEMAIFYVPNLTAVTGGTGIVTGITATPTSTTPAFSSGTEITAMQNNIVSDGQMVFASVPIQAVPGQRTGIVIYAISGSSATWTNIIGTISAIEM